MTNKNGNIVKWLGILLALGLAITGWVWNAAILSSTVTANVKEDGEVHAMTRENKHTLIEHGKDIAQNRRDIETLQTQVVQQQKEILDGQKEILRALATR